MPCLHRDIIPSCGHALFLEHHHHSGLSSLLWYPLTSSLSVDSFLWVAKWLPGWLLVIGVYAGVFLVTSALALEWTYEIVIYLVIFVLVIGTTLKPEVTSLSTSLTSSPPILSNVFPPFCI